MSALPRMDCPSDDDYALWLELLALKASPALLEAIGDSLEEYLRVSGRTMYVMGLSGGIDSSFLAAVLHDRGIPYLGFCLPIASNTPAEIDRGTRVAEAYANPPFGIRFDPVRDFSELYAEISRVFGSIQSASTPLAEGNIKARIRMMFLYHMAQLHGGCVLSTDQLDELLTGFWTLHGDVGDVSPIQHIPKSVEYELARMLCARLADPAPLYAAIEAVPTDGLGISSSDLDQLQVDSYAEVERLFTEYFTLKLRERAQGLNPDERSAGVRWAEAGPVRRFLLSGYKRRGAALFDPRAAC